MATNWEPGTMPDWAEVTYCEKCGRNMPLSHFVDHMEIHEEPERDKPVKLFYWLLAAITGWVFVLLCYWGWKELAR